MYKILLLIFIIDNLSCEKKTSIKNPDSAESKNLNIESLEQKEKLAKKSGINLPESLIIGNWEAEPCEGRKYKRQLNLNKEGGFTMVDLIAPCPPKARCFWSGIVHLEGNWKITGNLIILDYETVEGKQLEGEQKYPGMMIEFTRILEIIAQQDGKTIILKTKNGPDLNCIYQKVH